MVGVTTERSQDDLKVFNPSFVNNYQNTCRATARVELLTQPSNKYPNANHTDQPFLSPQSNRKPLYELISLIPPSEKHNTFLSPAAMRWQTRKNHPALSC